MLNKKHFPVFCHLGKEENTSLTSLEARKCSQTIHCKPDLCLKHKQFLFATDVSEVT